MTRKVIYLTTDILREIAHRLAVTFFAVQHEPLPEFDDHDPALLDSALSLPRATFGRQELYPSLAAKGAVMFYSLVKNHPFSNGNKRIATASLLVFLYLNGMWIKSEQRALYRWAIRVARSPATDRALVVTRLTSWLDHEITRRRRGRRSGLFARIKAVLTWMVPLYWRRRRGGRPARRRYHRLFRRPKS